MKSEIYDWLSCPECEEDGRPIVNAYPDEFEFECGECGIKKTFVFGKTRPVHKLDTQRIKDRLDRDDSTHG